MMIVSAILKIIMNKWTYIIIAILSVTITISVLSLRIKSYKKKVNKLNEKIENLETTNTLLYKDNVFRKEQFYILNGFANSDSKIDNIPNEELSYEEKEAVNAISNDFYNYFNFIRMSND